MSRRDQPKPPNVATVKPSVAFHMIRHAESNNNKVYSDAKNLFRFGASDYDEEGFQRYVDTHRKADPHLSPLGLSQAECLAENYLVTALLEHQASLPLRVLCSPMLRTILTIRPTIERLIMSSLREECSNGTSSSSSSYNNGYNHKRRPLRHKIHLIIVSFYHEIEGCHTKGRPEPGMSPNEIREYMFQNITIDADDDDDDDKEKIKIDQCDIDDIVTFEFVGFGDLPTDGWYAHGTGHESRIDAEARSAKYCLWLSEYLDNLMFSPSTNKNDDDDLFDVACLLPGEEKEDQHDKFLPILRRRRTVLAIGHGDFMSVVLKRLVGGYVGNGGRVVERLGLPHRTAFAHYNTGVTELEYFGHSRFIVMTTNVTPHIPPEKYRELRSGGTLRDGWAFTVTPIPDITVEMEVINDNNDDNDIHNHVQEQTIALKALYLSSSLLSEEIMGTSVKFVVGGDSNSRRFVVKRGFQILAVSTYSERTGQMTDVAIRPTAATVPETLIGAIRDFARSSTSSMTGNECHMYLSVRPRTAKHINLFKQMGFSESQQDDKGTNGNNQAIMTTVL